MKCKKLNCDKEAQPNFEACSALHGADIRMFRKQIDLCFDADDINSVNLIYRNQRELYTVEEALAYVN